MNKVIYGSLLLILLAASGAVKASETLTINPSEAKKLTHSDTQSHNAEGVLNSIDLKNNKINLTHGPVKSLRWPAMTMDFTIKDASMLQGIKPGQQVSFEIIKEAEQSYYVTKVTALK
jgi:Cu(I)/Ag(I) efflux system membrane fusion protein